MPVHPWNLFLAFFFFVLLPVSGLNPQGEAFLAWKRTLNGSLEPLSNWDPTDDTPCEWFGLTCNFNKEVVELNLKYMDLLGNVPSNFSSLASLNKLVLSGTNLSGSIPKEIGILQELVYLDLSDNALTGEIPGEICHLPKVERLVLNTNRLEGSIPTDIGNLTALMSLIIYDNQLSGAIPGSIGNLKRLEVIRAGGNKNLAGSIPQEIGNCTNLIMLGLAETSISGFLPPSLGLLQKLETIAVYTTLLSGQIPPELGACTALENIYLYENSLSGSIPTNLGNLHNLQNLLLWQNNLVGTIPPELGNCHQLLVIDISMNSLTGSIPETFGNLALLQELQLSVNQISGKIPAQLGNCTALTHIELDNNQITGTIPSEFGNLPNLTLLFLWQNRLEGNIPPSLSACHNLEAIDMSQNILTGPIPKGIFELQQLNKLLLLSNNLSGTIPSEIGNCSSLIRFRASSNMLTGSVPPEIGRLKNINFLDLGSNRLNGIIPLEIAGCQNLTFLDLHSNSLSGQLPGNLNQLATLQFLDVSENFIEGTLNPSLGSLSSLTKLILGKNRLSGSIPSQLGSCSRLQLLDLSSNGLEGQIPASLGKIPALEIALNLSWNKLSGEIPSEFTALDKLGVLDLSYNQLSGDLHYLADLQNLVVLNVSHNQFWGHVPDTSFFAKLPLSVLAGNPELCFSGNECSADKGGVAKHSKAARVAMVVLLCTACVLLLAALYIILGGKMRGSGAHNSDLDSDGDVELGPPWEVTVYQKLDLSIVDVTKCLTAVNVIGCGRSGIVYRANIPSGLVIAVKRFRASEKCSASTFSSEITTLARIRHRNIVRLLGWADNRKTKLLFYDYMPNGTLGSLLHEGCGGVVEWETRFKIALGVAEGLAYLHHDCVPPILHRDVKAHNILLGDQYEPCLADFGLARLVEEENASFSANPQFAGSYGYFAPEYACMLKITEKSDVYSYGVVLLEIITGKKPVDPSFPDGQHVIQWVRDHLKSKKHPVDIIDQKLQGNTDTLIQEMLQGLGIALLCTSNRPEDRPTMKDVVALLKEIRHEQTTGSEAHKTASKSPKISEVSSNSSTSVTPAQLLVKGSSNCSLAYSSSSASYNTRHQ
ncbi:Leucine-rich receptor-like protein kinase family protein [Forsythia ovata]|uniref:non-specific serine/threonine protein kinase n=1 Tax=Forsythia ovata TaxID=205694 RepID=A0ABD1P6N4_9LAMI